MPLASTTILPSLESVVLSSAPPCGSDAMDDGDAIDGVAGAGATDGVAGANPNFPPEAQPVRPRSPAARTTAAPLRLSFMTCIPYDRPDCPRVHGPPDAGRYQQRRSRRQQRFNRGPENSGRSARAEIPRNFQGRSCVL